MQIFIPDVRGEADVVQLLTGVGLEELLREGDAKPQTLDVPANGPHGGPGLILHWDRPRDQPQRATWKAAAPDSARKLPAKRFWISFDPNESPETLKRDAMLQGIRLTLCDGCEWLVPNVTSLPFRFSIDDEGHACQTPTAKAVKVQERMLWAFNALHALITEKTPIPIEEAIAYAAEMLSLNYRVNREICLELGLFDRDKVLEVLKFSTDLPRLIAIAIDVKKKEAA
jgi:hypothetical protein